MSVDVHVYGECAPLPAGIDAGAYRVIQEGLTNALKHAAALLTAVTLDYRPDALTLEIGDRTRTIVSDNTGHGLIGMHSGPQRTQRISTTWPTTTPNVTTFIRDTAQRIFEVW
jgi:signal transduction histidine kinase